MAVLYLPDSGDVNFLYGVLLLENYHWKQAKKRFLKSLEDNSFKKCEPYYYIGEINARLGIKNFGTYYKKYKSCLFKKLESLKSKKNKLLSSGNNDFDTKMVEKKVDRKILKTKKTGEFFLNMILKSLKGKRGFYHLKKEFRKAVKLL